MAKILTHVHPTKPFIVRMYKPTQTEKWFATLAEAEAFLPEAIKIEQGGSAESFRDYATRWLDQTALAKRPGTVRHHRIVLKNHIFPVIGDMALADITREVCKSLILDPDLTRSMASKIGVMLSTVLNEAVRDKRVTENVARGIKVRYNGRRAELIPVTFSQIETISAELRQWGLVPWLQYGCGLRIGEALAIRTDSVREHGTVLRVEEQVNLTRRGKDALFLMPLKARNTGDFRDVPLPSWLRERIDSHIAEHDIQPGGYLFPDMTQPGMSPSTFYLRFEHGKAKVGLPELHPHMLRHYFASIMLANKIPITDVSRWLGHKNIQLTFDTYSHLMPSSASEARTISDQAMKDFSEGNTEDSGS